MSTHSPNGPDSADTSKTLTFTPPVGQARVASGGRQQGSRTNSWLTDRSVNMTAWSPDRATHIGVVAGVLVVLAAAAAAVFLRRRRR